MITKSNVISSIYRDRDHMPVPKYREGQTVFVVDEYHMLVESRLIRGVEKPVWREYDGRPDESRWIVRYRYQDIICGKPFGRMHTEYRLDEDEIFPTEKEAVEELARVFMAETRKTAEKIAGMFTRLGMEYSEGMKLLSMQEHKEKE